MNKEIEGAIDAITKGSLPRAAKVEALKALGLSEAEANSKVPARGKAGPLFDALFADLAANALPEFSGKMADKSAKLFEFCKKNNLECPNRVAHSLIFAAIDAAKKHLI